MDTVQLELSAAAISSLQEQLEYSETQVRSVTTRTSARQCIAVGGSGAVAARKLCVHVVRCMQRTAAVMAERSTMRTLAVSTAALPRGVTAARRPLCRQPLHLQYSTGWQRCLVA